MGSEEAAPKFWFQFRYKYALYTNFLVIAATLGIFTFKNFSREAEDLFYLYNNQADAYLKENSIASTDNIQDVSIKQLTKLKEGPTEDELTDTMSDPTK